MKDFEDINKSKNSKQIYRKENTKKQIDVEHVRLRQGTKFNLSCQPKHVSLVYLIGQFEVPSSKVVRPIAIYYFISVLYFGCFKCKCIQLAITIWRVVNPKPVWFLQWNSPQLTQCIVLLIWRSSGDVSFTLGLNNKYFPIIISWTVMTKFVLIPLNAANV